MMKTACRQHGCHFPEEFDKTLASDCPYWHDINASALSNENKKIVWDWMFTVPADKISIEDKLAMGITIQFSSTMPANQFENFVPNWSKMNEEEQKTFQREYMKDPETMTRLVEQAKKPKTTKLIVS